MIIVEVDEKNMCDCLRLDYMGFELPDVVISYKSGTLLLFQKFYTKIIIVMISLII